MRQEILGDVRRRRWSDAQKRKILEEVGVDGAKVADVARRHDLTRQHLYQWRNHLRQKSSLQDQNDITFLPVDMEPIRGSASTRNDDSTIEITLCNGRILRSSVDLSENDLIRLIRVVERA